MRETILDAMGRLLWGLAWADHVDAAACHNISDCDIFDVMPEVPEAAEKEAETLLRALEATAAPVTIEQVFAGVCARGKLMPTAELQTRFGECLVYQSMGHGVSWADDHPADPILDDLTWRTRHDSDLEAHAEESCERCNPGTYRVVRFYREAGIRRRTIKTGLTLAQARAHCNDPETSSSTCTRAAGKRRTRQFGDWFDGYESEDT